MLWIRGMARPLIQMAVSMMMAAAMPARAQELLADPAAMLLTGDRHDFVGANRLSVQSIDNTRYLKSTPQNSASAIYQAVRIEQAALRHVTWTWRVDPLHTTADLQNLTKEDVGAAIMFVFGEPSVFNRDVSTLAYVWSSTPVPNGSIVPSLRLKWLRYVQLRGNREAGRWAREARDVTADFAMAFGRPAGALRYVVVFSDNDQTGEPVSALFGSIFASP